MNKTDQLDFIVAHVNELSSLFRDLLDRSTFLGPNKRTSISRYKILKSLDKLGPQCLTDISIRVHCKTNTLSEIVSRMINDSQVRRLNNDRDRRKTDLAITAAGRAVMIKYDQTVAHVIHDYLGTMPAPLRESFLKSLGSLIKISLRCRQNAAYMQNKARAK